jgi:hypothetical protein
MVYGGLHGGSHCVSRELRMLIRLELTFSDGTDKTAKEAVTFVHV